ncbi:MAG: DUF3467 domain-containing protein [Actinomycetota bacterium]|nr:DUF3467 domain-containing protein [Actinomycetota bacterium]
MADLPGDQPPQKMEIILQPEQMAGVWANWAQVGHSEHEFTLDFVRVEYGATPVRGIVVARVSVSPLFVTQLIEALNTNWQAYAEKALPKEVSSGETEGGEASPGEA